MNILYLDNDECLGYFSFISGLYTETVCDYCLKLKLEEKNLDRINAEAIFILFASELLDMGFARPGLKEFFYKLKKFKNRKLLDKIIMYTSAERYSKTEKNYVNWVAFMKNLFEFYSTKKHDDSKDMFLIYDLDHSGRSDEIPRESPDGATLKSVEVPLKRLGISMHEVNKIVFLDDRPQNIYIDGDENQKKLKRIGVLPYYYLPKRENLKEICAKYDDDFMKVGMKSLTSILDSQYDNELQEFNDNKYPIGIPYFDMSELEENDNKRLDTPPPSIDISGEAKPKKINIAQSLDDDNISIDITKMLEGSIPNDTKSVNFSYELYNHGHNDSSQNQSLSYDLKSAPSIDINLNMINDKSLNKPNVQSIETDKNSIQINESDMEKIDLKPSELFNEFNSKIEMDVTKDINNKLNTSNGKEKTPSFLSDFIEKIKFKPQIAGKVQNKDKLLYEQSVLSDISALSISQSAMSSQSIENSNQLSKNKLENFSIDISNNDLQSMNISREISAGLNSSNIPKEISISSLPSINISNELNKTPVSINISKELNIESPSINISKDLNTKMNLKDSDFLNEIDSVAKIQNSDNSQFINLSNFSLKYD